MKSLLDCSKVNLRFEVSYACAQMVGRPQVQRLCFDSLLLQTKVLMLEKKKIDPHEAGKPISSSRCYRTLEMLCIISVKNK